MNNDVEASDSLLSFGTDGYVVDNLDHVERVMSRLNLVFEDKTTSLIEYLTKQIKWLERGLEE
jgi:hypothetical protein